MKRKTIEVYHDDLTNLDFIDIDDYLQHNKFTRSKYSDLLSNQMIVDYFHNITRKLISFMCYSDVLLNDTSDYHISYVLFVKRLYWNLKDDYENYLENENMWKYVDISFDDIIKYINLDINGDEIFGNNSDYYQRMFKHYKKYL